MAGFDERSPAVFSFNDVRLEEVYHDRMDVFGR